MRQTIIAANWKMHKTLEEGLELAVAIKAHLQSAPTTDKIAILCTPYIHLFHMVETFREVDHIHVGAQNCHQELQGAYTGEISPQQLSAMGVPYVILGHSERRQYFGEDEALLKAKVDQALAQELQPIFCCGEPLEVRETDGHKALVKKQVEEALFHLSAEQIGETVIAYEPVWAIGTGKVASPEQAQEMHAHIRQLVADHYGTATADKLSILYGGSVKPNNAADIFQQPDVDGGLIGGASLKAEDFTAIYQAG